MSFEGWNNAAVPPSPESVVRARMRQLLWDLWSYLDDEQANDSCDAGNFDGGSPDTCSHCIRQGYINQIREVTDLDRKVDG